MIKLESTRPVAIEDLLRLKRAERPPVEFWSQFDRELRAKQLAALLSRRPWWQRLPSVWPVFARHRIFIGASAVLVVTVVSLRSPRQPALPVAAGETVIVVAAHDVSQPVINLAVATQVAGNNFLVTEPMVAMSQQEALLNRAEPAAAAIATVTTIAEPAATTMPLIGLPLPTPEHATPAPVARFVATGLVAVAPTDTGARRASGAGFEARAGSPRTTVEPLHQMTSPSETRRTRLLTAMVSMASLETSARTTERVANRIDEERLYEQVHRFGARGDRLNVKF